MKESVTKKEIFLERVGDTLKFVVDFLIGLVEIAGSIFWWLVSGIWNLFWGFVKDVWRHFYGKLVILASGLLFAYFIPVMISFLKNFFR